jgi:hypothetical protein
MGKVVKDAIRHHVGELESALEYSKQKHKGMVESIESMFKSTMRPSERMRHIQSMLNTTETLLCAPLETLSDRSRTKLDGYRVSIIECNALGELESLIEAMSDFFSFFETRLEKAIAEDAPLLGDDYA